jgi:diadenosine tetraphosphate (Ap4A) HIT family hydrolase
MFFTIAKNCEQKCPLILFEREKKIIMCISNCIFCKILSGKLPCFKIAETQKSLAFMDINPISKKGHCLIIPREHAAKFHELSEESCADMGRLLSRVSKAMDIENYNILQNNGRIANQAVDHVHFHIIPKTSEDGLFLSWNPINPVDRNELKKMADNFASKMKELEEQEGKSDVKK